MPAGHLWDLSVNQSEYNPQRLKSCAFAKYLRTKEKSVKLLYNKYQDCKEYNLDRIYNNNYDTAHNTTDVRSKVRNHISNSNDNAYKHRVRELEYSHTYKADDTDY